MCHCYVYFQAAANLSIEINNKGEKKLLAVGVKKKKEREKEFSILDYWQLSTLITYTYNDFENRDKTLSCSKASTLLL